ncbi:T9SS type A sorting domain-containing protein [Lewinella sp. LCG006]|uniref:T9SS type A sorting domain-containing protein n=1 Tax=Lewinella sp. LCG006 TaxID=3231911 RepID=UPI00345FC51C
MKSKNQLLTFFFFLLFSTSILQAQDCDNDVTPPNVICFSDINLIATEGTGITFSTTDIDANSFDDCGPVTLRLTTSDEDTGVPPTTTSVTIPPVIGTYIVVMYAIDPSGNWNNCFSEVNIVGINDGSCDDDNEPPSIFCITGLTAEITPGTNFVTIFAQDIIQSFTENCDPNPSFSINLITQSTGAPQGQTSLNFNVAAEYPVEVWAVDEAGNATSCETYVNIIGGNGECNDDTVPPVVICESQLSFYADPFEDNLIWTTDIDEGSYDWCSNVDLRIVLSSESDGSLPSTTSVLIPPVVGTYPVELWAVDASGNTNVCYSEIVVDGIITPITGQVYIDDNDNCDLDAGETGLGGWQVLISSTNSNRSSLVTTNNDGIYYAPIKWPEADLSNIEVQLLLPDGFSTGCVSSIILPTITEQVTTVNFAASLTNDCTFLTVDVAAPLLRRCFPNQIYLNYANYSSFAAENAVITIELDPFLSLTNATVPFTNLGDGQYEFDLGTIPAASAGSITLTATLSCEAQLGATHCVQATIQPFTCIPASSFAELSVTGECDPGTGQVNFTIANTGNSDMTTAQNYRIVEDVIMYMNQNPVQLNAGQSEAISFPANGATWRLEIEQDDSYPFGGIAAAFVEGCGGFTPGIATQFLLENTKPNIDQLCIENIGSWDPNDKQALPRGYGEQHFIEANSPLEYLIRFQNTGTDTAFNIRIEDQLSEHLDISSLVPGASSHPYRMELKEDGQLLFHFDDILLPDSTTNFEASNGFVQFAIRQLPDNPIGTIIENTADIYFDFNEAVVTNTVTHTIGEDFILVSTQDVLVPGLTLNVAPNPLHSSSLITLQGLDLNDGQCLIYDTQGRLLSRHAFSGQQLILQRDGFPNSGLYFFRLFDGSRPLAQGKLIVK